MTNEIVKSTCDICSAGCGILIYMDNDRPFRIDGDPDSPINRGAICAKGLASLEYLYHPDRLKHPLRRMGERGAGKWQQISWDEALSTVAEELQKAKDNYGAESVAFIRGAYKGLRDEILARFGNAFGSPNHTWMGHVCFTPRYMASNITYGFYPYQVYEPSPDCLVVWGSNPIATNIWLYEQTIRTLNDGAKLIVIDPRKTELAERADLWMQLRPGSDLALVLGMIHVVIAEDLYDKNFVDNWTVGFNELKSHIQSYKPEDVQEITWVPARRIKEAARLYATTKPACIQSGNGIDQGVNSFQTARAIDILRSITGNLEIPGGEAKTDLRPINFSPELRLTDKLPIDQREKRVDAEYKVLPIISSVLPQSIVKAIADKKPYSIHMAYIQGCNPLLSWSNSQETYNALKKLDYLVVADNFMTPTAALADLVLPAATYLEFDGIVSPASYPAIQIQQKVATIGEAWSDIKILNELSKKLGLEEYFWENEEDFLDDMLKPYGVDFKEFRKVGVMSGTKRYRSYEVDGFKTSSSKVELYSSKLKEWGFDPLPTYRESPETPYSFPKLADDYPLILTSWKSAEYRHSGGRQIATLRGMHPEPIIFINHETAKKLGIVENDLVYIETRRGRIKQKAILTNDIDPRVVGVDYDWWFPEKHSSSLYSWQESNINILTDNKPPFNREMGSSNLRGIVCRVYKVS